MRSEHRRLRTIARKAGLCPTHLVKLCCHTCTTTWTGTDEAWAELAELLARVEPYYPPGRAQGQCDRGHDLICEECWRHDARLTIHAMPEETITIPEMERMTVLLKHFKRGGE